MKRILVVDDDGMNCVLAKGALGESYEVHTVNTGSDALEYMESNEVDLVLMDIMMPGMSGKEAAQKMRRLFSRMLFAAAHGALTRPD